MTNRLFDPRSLFRYSNQFILTGHFGKHPDYKLNYFATLMHLLISDKYSVTCFK